MKRKDAQPIFVMLMAGIFLLSAFLLVSCRNPTSSVKPGAEEAKVIFYLAGGQPEIEPKIVPLGSRLTPVPAPTRAGHRFQGWYPSSAPDTRWDFENDRVTEDKVLYARWGRAGGGGGGGGAGGPGGPPGGPVPIHPPANKNVLQQLLWLHNPLYPDRVQGGAGRIYVVTSRPTVLEDPIPGGNALGVYFAGRDYVHVLLIGEGPGRKIWLDSAGAMLTVANTNTLTLQNIALEGTAGNAANPVIDVLPGGTLRMRNNSVVRDNSWRGVRANSGIFNMYYNALVTNNAGGGVFLENGAIFNMNGNAAILNNYIPFTSGVHFIGTGGGIHAQGAGTVITMNYHARIEGNTVGYRGGGVFLENNAVLRMYYQTRIFNNESGLAGTGYGGGLQAFTGSRIYMYANAWIHGNSSRMGAGMLINNSTLTMRNTTRVYDNTANPVGGGGITMNNGAVLRMYDSAAIRDNQATAGSGGGIFMSGTLPVSTIHMNHNSRIKFNQAPAGAGGGILMNANSVLIMNGSAWIFDNTAANGGGVDMVTVTAGAVPGQGSPTLNMNGNSRINYNTATSIVVGNHIGGGGVRVTGAAGFNASITMNGLASIMRNRSHSHGGGVLLNNNASLTMLGNSCVYDNRSGFAVVGPGEASRFGGGVHVVNSAVTMNNDARIRYNINNSPAGGGGVNMINGSTLRMYLNSSITGNQGGGGGGGGGIRMAAGTSANRNVVRMFNTASITNNKGNHSGGGLQIQAFSTLYMLDNGTRISGNRAGGVAGPGNATASGGGVGLTENSSQLRISGGTIYGVNVLLQPTPATHHLNPPICSRSVCNLGFATNAGAPRNHALNIAVGLVDVTPTYGVAEHGYRAGDTLKIHQD